MGNSFRFGLFLVVTVCHLSLVEGTFPQLFSILIAKCCVSYLVKFRSFGGVGAPIIVQLCCNRTQDSKRSARLGSDKTNLCSSEIEVVCCDSDKSVSESTQPAMHPISPAPHKGDERGGYTALTGCRPDSSSTAKFLCRSSSTVFL